MGRSKQTIHGCTMLISGLRRRIIAVFAPRTMLRWSIGHNYLVDPVVSNWRAHEARQNSLSQLTQPAYSVRGMSCLNPLGYVRSKFPAEILISLASVHLLWKFSSPSVASHWSAILNFAKLNPRSRSAKMKDDLKICKIDAVQRSFKNWRFGNAVFFTLKKATLPKRRLKLFWTASILQFSNKH